MSKIILILIISVTSCSLYAQQPTVKIYHVNGNINHYNIEEIVHLRFITSKLSYKMCIFGKYSAFKSEFDLRAIDSLRFENKKMIIVIDGNNIEHDLKEIDSIILIWNTCEEIQIGNQTWMCKNLDVDHYKNGDPITEVRDSIEWVNLTSGAWCYYNNDSNIGKEYGRLYNWYAVNDPRGLSPEGWHIPSDGEWKVLEVFLGTSTVDVEKTGYRGDTTHLLGVGAALKEEGLIHWFWETGNNATNESGFTAFGGGYRLYMNVEGYGSFNNYLGSGQWWTSTSFDTETAWLRHLCAYHADVYRSNWKKNNGCSVRCIKD